MYKIIEKIYFNELGKPGAPRYCIQELKPVIPFLGWKRWVYVKETKCGWGDTYKVRMEWDSLEEAQKFIDEILCPGILREKTQTKEIKTVNCND